MAGRLEARAQAFGRARGRLLNGIINNSGLQDPNIVRPRISESSPTTATYLSDVLFLQYIQSQRWHERIVGPRGPENLKQDALRDMSAAMALDLLHEIRGDNMIPMFPSEDRVVDPWKPLPQRNNRVQALITSELPQGDDRVAFDKEARAAAVELVASAFGFEISYAFPEMDSFGIKLEAVDDALGMQARYIPDEEVPGNFKLDSFIISPVPLSSKTQ